MAYKKLSLREEGLVGTFFCPPNSTSAIIVLGGSSGGLSEERAERLAQQGLAALALAYFGMDPLPRTLKQIPLEYFEKAIRWLQEKQQIKKIGLWGTSRGAELSLVLGSLFADHIHAIAAHVPTSVVYGALDNPDLIAWTYQGKAIVPNATFKIEELSSSGDTEDTALSVTPQFIAGMKDRKAFAASAIPVEKITCPLLLISAQEDQMWPSTLFAEQIVERLIQHRSPISYLHLSYPGVGHAPQQGKAGFHPIVKKWFAYGGNAQDNAFAIHDWFNQTVFFFREKLLH